MATAKNIRGTSTNTRSVMLLVKDSRTFESRVLTGS
jgi:hypothetical protein